MSYTMGNGKSKTKKPLVARPALADDECWCWEQGWSVHSGGARPRVRKTKIQKCTPEQYSQHEGYRRVCLTPAQKLEWNTTGRVVAYQGALKADGTPATYGGKRRKRRRRKTRRKKRTKKKARRKTRRRRKRKLKR